MLRQAREMAGGHYAARLQAEAELEAQKRRANEADQDWRRMASTWKEKLAGAGAIANPGPNEDNEMPADAAPTGKTAAPGPNEDEEMQDESEIAVPLEIEKQRQVRHSYIQKNNVLTFRTIPGRGHE